MTNHDFGGESAMSNRTGLGQRTAKAAGDAFSNATALAGDAASKAREAASETAATVAGQVKEILDRKVGSGADVVGHVAGAVRRAAQELEQEVPQLAGLVRTAGDQIDGYAEGLRGQSAEQLMRAASDFTRRQPAIVFGLAAVAGFFALRVLKSTPASVSSPPIQPTHHS